MITRTINKEFTCKFSEVIKKALNEDDEIIDIDITNLMGLLKIKISLKCGSVVKIDQSDIFDLFKLNANDDCELMGAWIIKNTFFFFDRYKAEVTIKYRKNEDMKK